MQDISQVNSVSSSFFFAKYNVHPVILPQVIEIATASMATTISHVSVCGTLCHENPFNAMINNIAIDLCASVLEVAKTSRICGNYHYLVCTGLLVSGVNPKGFLEAKNISVIASPPYCLLIFSHFITCAFSPSREHHKCLVMVPYHLEDLTWNH